MISPNFVWKWNGNFVEMESFHRKLGKVAVIYTVVNLIEVLKSLFIITAGSYYNTKQKTSLFVQCEVEQYF